MTKVYLSLGSNMGDRQGYLQKAVKALNDLPETEVKAVSSYYETAAWGLTNQLIFESCLGFRDEVASRDLTKVMSAN